MAPASRWEKPSMRVYSSPKPTQPDSSTTVDANSRPQNFSCRGLAATAGWMVAMACIIAQAPGLLPCDCAMFKIVLFQPEIPPNTGNVIRLCANSGSSLHLVKPLGFDLCDKAVRRAGLDYDELASVEVHAGLEECLSALAGAR